MAFVLVARMTARAGEEERALAAARHRPSDDVPSPPSFDEAVISAVMELTQE